MCIRDSTKAGVLKFTARKVPAITPSKIKRPAPKLGEHSKEILDHLGITEEAQNKMIQEGKVILSDK